MAFTSMHLATGMACSGALAVATCFVLRRGWRWIPAVMTAGAIWAIVPDLPRIFREDFPSLPLAGILGSKALENTLHDWGNLFFFHQSLDAQPHEYALLGIGLILLFYNASIIGLMAIERRQYRRLQQSYRASRAHQSVLNSFKAMRENAPAAASRLEFVRSSHLSRSA